MAVMLYRKEMRSKSPTKNSDNATANNTEAMGFDMPEEREFKRNENKD